MNILIVEDEIVVAMDIKRSLEDIGYKVVDIASNNFEVDEIVSKSDIDLVLMDINLEDSQLDGIDIASNINIPIIYITAYSDDKTINRAIQTNPLGYILKPFNIEELKVNINLAKYKLGKKLQKGKNEKLDLGYGYNFDYELNELFFYDMHIPLGKNEKKLLKLLIDAQGNIVSNNSIESEVWKENIVSDNTRRNLIYRLRTKLEYKIIETISDVGCRLITFKDK